MLEKLMKYEDKSVKIDKNINLHNILIKINGNL